jgi:hypothetical protein
MSQNIPVYADGQIHVKLAVPGVVIQTPLLTHGKLEQGLIGIAHVCPV